MTETFDPAPTTLGEVIAPAWLSAMLRPRWPDASVRAVRVVETLATQATKVRLALDIDGDDTAPRHICIKGILTDTGAPPSASIVETLFYAHLAERVDVRVPPCIHARMSAANDRGVIVMQDLKVAGATFLSALGPFRLDDMRAALDQIATLHIAGWQGRPLFDTPFVPRFLDMIGAKPIIPQAMLQEMMDGERGAPLPVSVKDAGRLQRAIAALAAQVRERPSCLVHGDAHAGNIYRNSDGLGLVDWQVLQKGEWAQDVAYTITAALTPEDRRLHERDLLSHYCDRLRTLGGPDMPREEAWTRYRAALIYGYYLWAITRKVEPAITNAFNHRLGLAVAELDSFAAVGV